jgi:hypothetical protein
MSMKTRLAQLEKRRDEQPFKPPQKVEVWGTREDGTRYLLDTWGALVECNSPLTDRDGNPLDIEHERSLTTFREAVTEIVNNEQS